MFTLVNEKKKELQEQQKLKQALLDQLHENDIKYKEKQVKKEQLEDEINTYKNKKLQLQRKRLTYFITRMTGDVQERMQQLKQQLMILEEEFEKINDELMHIIEQSGDIREKIANLSSIDEEYASILTEQAQLIKQLNTPLSKKYLDIDIRIVKLEKFLEKSKQAIQIGIEAKAQFIETRTLLKKAARWGILDVLGGKGYSAHKKHKYIQEANDGALLAQSKRKILENKVSQIRHDSDIDFQIEESFVFMDFVLDGIYINLLVQEKIEEAIHKVDVQMNEVHKIMNQLEFRSNKAKQEIATLTDERDLLLQEIEKNNEDN